MPRHYRIRRGEIDQRHHHPRAQQPPAPSLGRRYAGTRVLILAHELHIRVLTQDGQLLRELTLDPTRDHQPQPKP